MLVGVMVEGGCANVTGLIPGTLELAEMSKSVSSDSFLLCCYHCSCVVDSYRPFCKM